MQWVITVQEEVSTQCNTGEKEYVYAYDCQ
jgi:hypothetical protein